MNFSENQIYEQKYQAQEFPGFHQEQRIYTTENGSEHEKQKEKQRISGDS